MPRPDLGHRPPAALDPATARTTIPLGEIEAARERIAGRAVRTPLVRLNVDQAPAEIWLKLENLQPIGSFKIRGAANAMVLAGHDRLARGVYTASAGNMAQGVAWNARRFGVPAWSVVPDSAPTTKLEAIARLGAQAVKVPFDEWWEVLVTHRYEPLADRVFVHPVSDPAVMAGNGTIGLEILEDLPDVDAVVVPYGGGGLSSGIASAMKQVKPSVRALASEVDTAAPLAAALAAGRPQQVAYTASFVDGIGGRSVLPEMWPLVRDLLDGSLVVTPAQAAEAVRLLAERNRVVAEGAAGTAVAAALAGMAGPGRVVCVASGGNIDSGTFARILAGEVP
jgi:threonine dehydratase